MPPLQALAGAPRLLGTRNCCVRVVQDSTMCATKRGQSRSDREGRGAVPWFDDCFSPPLMMKKILVATDFSPGADRALDEAIELARQADGHIELIHVLQAGSFVLPPPLDIVALPLENGEIAHDDVALAERARRVSRAGVTVHTRVEAGAPHEEIVKAAKEMGAELLVVGSHGKSALSEILVGSVAARLIRHAPCPVLVVPTPT